MSRSKTKQVSYISIPSHIIPSLSNSSVHNLLLTPPKKPARSTSPLGNPKFPLLLLLLIALFETLQLGFRLSRLLPLPPCSTLQPPTSQASAALGAFGSEVVVDEFWKQPDGMGYRPCLQFSDQYQAASAAVRANRRKFLMVVVSGGLNQQRNQIVDAVVIARILGAALVVPILQVNVIWGDESEFSDIFDLGHFKRVLADDVRIVNSLPSTHIRTRPVEEKRTPMHASPDWIRSRYLRRLNKEGVLLLRSLDSRLSKDLPADLQKLRCKVAFEALKFSAPILELGNKLVARMRSKGPYLALHLRMEKDVWVRTGCLPGLTTEYDNIIRRERELRPELLTARSNMSYHERKLAGLCPLNAVEVTRLLKALQSPQNARIYWAGGEPFGGPSSLLPLIKEFPNFFSKGDLLLSGELEPVAKKASLLAAIDYIVCEQSNVFMPSHGGNMGHMIKGHRAFAGHLKFITPNNKCYRTFLIQPSQNPSSTGS